MHAVERGRKLLLIRRWTRFPVIGRCRIIVDLAQWDPVPPPATLEFPRVHVEYEDALGIHDVHLVGVFVQVKEEDPARKRVRVLIILLQGFQFFPWCRAGTSMTKVPEKLPIACEFLDAVPARRSR